MLKARITNKELREGYYTIELSYGAAQNILKFQPARFYNYGVYGWNYDVYEIDWNIAICTGYRPVKSIPEKLNKQAKEIVNKYDKKASTLCSWNYKRYENYRKAIDRLYNNMVRELNELINYTSVNGEK